MVKLMDNKRIIAISMQEWDGSRYRPDWSNDFFDVGLLSYDEGHDAYIVDNVDYCIDMALDWKHARGDFQEGVEVNPDDRMVMVDNEQM